jgi:hypothetical protein
LSSESSPSPVIQSLNQLRILQSNFQTTLPKSQRKNGREQLLNFDWQRFFKQPHLARKNVLVDAAKRGQDAALAYFERLAEGADSGV